MMREDLQKQFPPVELETGTRIFGLDVVTNQNLTATYIALEIQSGEKPDDSLSIYRRLSPASDFLSSLATISDEREILRRAVRNLWRVYRFNQHYIGYLGGGVTADDFHNASEQYVQEPEQFDDQFLKHAAYIVLPLITDDELTGKDVAMVLNAETEQLELALKG